jgi:hypothetical protein
MNPRCYDDRSLFKRVLSSKVQLSMTIFHSRKRNEIGFEVREIGKARGHFRHETESPWPLHFKHSHWWKKRTRCKFASHYKVCECKVDVKSTWLPTWHRMDHVSCSLGLFSKTITWKHAWHETGKPWHSKRSQSSIYSVYHVWGPRMNRNALK